MTSLMPMKMTSYIIFNGNAVISIQYGTLLVISSSVEIVSFFLVSVGTVVREVNEMLR